MQIITTTIDTGWEVAERLPAGRDLYLLQGGEKDWIRATVPGHVHLDLVRAGVIGDPFYRMQERGCAWVDEADWTYRTTFTVDAERLAARGSNGRHFLHFQGLDTFARVYLNGVLIGEAENFFTPHRFDVTEALREGANELRVTFDSALRVGRERAAAYLDNGTSERGAMSYFNFGPRAFVRKPQYMFGWDWGPELVSCGLHQPVDLVTVPSAEITDARIDYTFLDADTVDITLTVTITKYDDAPLVVGASLLAAGETTPTMILDAGPGTHTITLYIHDFRCVRWHPNGAGGPQRRYLLNLRLAPFLNEGSPRWAVVKGFTIGFRTIELIREPDAVGQGEGFLFRVNGVDAFIKGANWIPDGCFPGAISPSRLRERLTQARDAGMNMLRVWGGGLYETDAFYDLCDELGLMVWQDFAFACSMYPDDLSEFREAVRLEATAAVRRLRHRPSLALWCGGNENLELAQGRWAGKTQATRFFGDAIIHEVLPGVLAAEDTRTPYWPNSPYGGDNATSEDYGDSHYWNVWHSKKPGSNGDWTNYAESTTRFSSEFGFAAPAGPAAWESVMAPEDETVDSAVSRWHDKTRKGYATYLGFIGMHYPAPQTLADLIYYGQANQANALQFGVEHWRRLKGRCWGTLFWQLNDCWPTHSWAVIDSAGEPKAAYYAARRFYAPVLLSLRCDKRSDRIEAVLVNDTEEAIPGRVVVRLLTFPGQEISRVETETLAPANAASRAVTLLDLAAHSPADRKRCFVHAAFMDSQGEPVAENIMLLAEPKYLELPAPGLAVAVEKSGDGSATLTVSAAWFAALVWLRFDELPVLPTFSDNWFHLLPGETRRVAVGNLPAESRADELRARLHVRHL